MGDEESQPAELPLWKTGDSALISERLAVPHRAIKLGHATIHVLVEDSFTTDPKFFFGDGGLLGDSQAAASARDKYLNSEGLLSNVVFGAVLVQMPGEGRQCWNVLLDTGLGETLMPSYLPKDIIAKKRAQYQLPKTMQQYAGVSPEEVNFVIHSHLHGDHIGWNVCRADGDANSEPVPTFAQACHIVQRAEWEYPKKHFACPWRDHFDVQCAPLEAKHMVQLVDETAPWEEVPGFSLISAQGHTPGHQCVRIESDGQVAYYIGDLLHTVAQIENPEWTGPNDCCYWSGEQAASFMRPAPMARASISAESRVSLLQRVHAEGALLISPHLPFPCAGRLKEAGGRFEWQPLSD